MNLRKEIEKLIYWYIPAILIVLFVGTVVSAQMKSVNEYSFALTNVALVSNLLINHMHNIVVAIWLYSLAKKMDQRYILWALFGLVAHLFAAVIFLVLNLLEESNLDEITEPEKTTESISSNVEEVVEKKSKRKLFIWSK